MLKATPTRIEVASPEIQRSSYCDECRRHAVDTLCRPGNAYCGASGTDSLSYAKAARAASPATDLAWHIESNVKSSVGPDMGFTVQPGNHMCICMTELANAVVLAT